MTPNEPSGADRLAGKLLGIRPRSEQELERRLAGRFGREEARATLERLRHGGYIDDLSFAAWWIDQRMAFKPKGRRLLRSELLRHGVATHVAGEALARLSREDELAGALAAARRKLPSLGGPRAGERLALFLGRRGFDHEVIDSVLRTVREQDGDFC